MTLENSPPPIVHPLQRALLCAALAAVAAAPLIYGSYPPWISGITIAVFCALGALWIVLALIFKTDFFPAPRSIKITALLLLAWLSAVVARDALGWAGPDRSPAASIRTLPYAIAFLSAGMLGAAFGTLQRL